VSNIKTLNEYVTKQSITREIGKKQSRMTCQLSIIWAASQGINPPPLLNESTTASHPCAYSVFQRQSTDSIRPLADFARLRRTRPDPLRPSQSTGKDRACRTEGSPSKSKNPVAGEAASGSRQRPDLSSNGNSTRSLYFAAFREYASGWRFAWSAAHPTHARALRKKRIHGESSPHSMGAQLI